MYNKINQQIKEAMKSKDKNKLSVLRILKADITTKAKELKMLENKLEQNIIIGVIEKTLKKYKEEMSFVKNKVKISELEDAIKLLESYLPEKLSIDKVKEIVNKVMKEVDSMGSAMRVLSKELKGKADMKEVKKLVDEYFKGVK